MAADVTPEDIVDALNAAGITEWFSVGVEKRGESTIAEVGVTTANDEVERRVREALAPTPVELHVGDRPRRY